MDLKEAQLDGILRRHPWEIARKQVVSDILFNSIPHLEEKPLFVLDMGSGDTWLVEELSKELPKAYFHAVDIAFETYTLTKLNSRFEANELPIRALQSMEESIKSQVGKIDLVLLLDVIEHIEDDVEFLKHLQSHPGIGPHTYILITVPAFQALFCSHDVFLEHYRRYTHTDLRQTLQQVGLQPIKKGYFFSSLLVPRALRVIKEKILGPGKAKGVGVWEGSQTKTEVLEKILLTDYRLGKMVGHKIPGLSNFMLCRPLA